MSSAEGGASRTSDGAAVPAVPSALRTRGTRLLRWTAQDRVPLRTILVVAGVLVAVYLAGKLLYRLRDVVLVVVVGCFLALVLNPLVAAVERAWVSRRGLAVTIVMAWAVIVFIGLAFAFGYPLVRGLTHLAHALPTYVHKAEQGKGWIGHLVRKYHVESWVRRNSPKLVAYAEKLGKPALSLGKGALSVFLSLGAMFVFVVLLLLEAPKMRRWVLGAVSPERAATYRVMGADITRAVSGYMLGNLLTSVVAGLVVFVALAALSVPFAPLWALWVALVDFLPVVGGALAGIPTVLFAFTHSLSAGIVTLVVFLVYTQVENHILNPVVMSKTVKVNPLLVFVAVLVGASIGAWVGGLFGGFAAALIAIPVAGALQVVVRHAWQASGGREPPVGAPADAVAAAPEPSQV